MVHGLFELDLIQTVSNRLHILGLVEVVVHIQLEALCKEAVTKAREQ